MELDLCPSVTLQTGTFSAVTAPAETITGAINANADLQRFMFLFVSGNYSRIMSDIHRTSGNFEVRRACTALQLVTILSGAYHSIILVEHDPTLYEGIGKSTIVPQVTESLRSAARDALVVLYTPAGDFTFHTLARKADRVVIIAPVTRNSASGMAGQWAERDRMFRRQKALEEFHGTQYYEQQDGSQGSLPAVVAGDAGAPGR
ncbi:MAG TPA: hypothetical protein P5217_03780 [Methanoregulaceae archaeon]|nr:hypothetical protein [Methanoregulaceae archaeon]HPD75076.1 hypothetical protein [Methanoregulaceae archaeon]HRY75382.1 hypothetical protein [Methanoregulaceae archaeon]